YRQTHCNEWQRTPHNSKDSNCAERALCHSDSNGAVRKRCHGEELQAKMTDQIGVLTGARVDLMTQTQLANWNSASASYCCCRSESVVLFRTFPNVTDRSVKVRHVRGR